MEHEYDLIRQIILGNSELFEQIVLEYQNLIFTICFNIVNNYNDAENIAQETFLTAFRSLPDYHGGSFKSWICRIAANKAIDFKRKHAKLIYEDFESYEAKTPNGDSLEEKYEQKERKEKVDNILSVIPVKYTLVIKAFYYDQLTVKEIARQMKLPEKTVATRLYRGKKIIRERWGNDGA
jgi:RNA polymerase sigma factor (sigma-70 family)